MIPALLLLVAPAQAGWPNDISLTSMSDAAGRPVVDPSDNVLPYETVVKQLGVAIANKPMMPADTLGINGAEFGVATTVVFNESQETEYGVPGAWGRVHEAEEPAGALVVPWIHARKGLPFSLEVGGQVGWLALSRQTAFGGYGRFSPLEGYRQAPDLSFQLGYSGYVGNSELELGVMDFATTLSYTLPFGRLVKINSASFTPFAGFGRLWMHAEPRLDTETQQSLGVRAVSGFAASEAYDPDQDFAPWTVHGGFRVVSQYWQFLASTQWAPGVVPTVTVGMGFSY